MKTLWVVWNDGKDEHFGVPDVWEFVSPVGLPDNWVRVGPIVLRLDDVRWMSIVC